MNRFLKYFAVILLYILYIMIILVGEKYNLISDSIFDNLISWIIELSFVWWVIWIYIKFSDYLNEKNANKYFIKKFLINNYFEREIPIIKLMHDYILENKKDFIISNELLKWIQDNKKWNWLNHKIVYETYKLIRKYFYLNASKMYDKLIIKIIENKEIYIYNTKEDIYYTNQVIINTKNNSFFLTLINNYNLLINNFNTKFSTNKKLMNYTWFYILINNWLQIRELIYSNFEDKNIKDDFKKFIKDIEDKEKKDSFFDRDDFVYLK